MYKSEKIRTGVIGVGSMGQNHARVYNEISSLIGVADKNEEQGRMVAERFGVAWFSDYKKLLKEVDAVTVAVPTILHRKIAEDAANAGVDILVEKPLSDNVVDASKIIETAKSNGVTLAVGHIERYNPIVSHVKSIIDSGELGQVVTISSKRVSKYPKRIKDVGVVFDLGIHDLDIIRYLSGSEVKKIFAVGGMIEYSNLDDHVSIIMEFQNDIKGLLEASWLTPMKVRQTTLTCTNAYVLMDYMSQSVEILRSEYSSVNDGNLSKIKHLVDSKKPKVFNQEPLQLELLDFLESTITTGRLPLVTGEDGLVAVSLAEEVVKSLN